TLTQIRTVRITVSRIPRDLNHPTQPTMLTPDYQEFANRAEMATRDNTVICGVRTGRSSRNRPSVAQLPRRKTSTKPELSAHAGHRHTAFGHICRFNQPLRSTRGVVIRDLTGFPPYPIFVGIASSGRLSITLSTMPKSRAI